MMKSGYSLKCFFTGALYFAGTVGLVCYYVLMNIHRQDNSVLEVKDLALSFAGKNIVAGLNLKINKADKMTLTGISGSGKTSVLKSIMGLVKTDKGQIIVNGKKLDKETVWQIRKNIAYVPQEPVLGHGSVKDLLQRTFELKANSHLHWNTKKAIDCFDRLGLSASLLKSQTELLSGGEKQRIAIALAILLQRKIFLLDEPVSALDAENAKRVNKFFFDYPDVAVLCAAHDPKSISFANKNVNLDYLKETY